jgi:hypothetical protein
MDILPAFNSENFGRSATAAAVAYATVPVVTGIDPGRQISMAAIPLVNRFVPNLSLRAGSAVIAFLTTFIVDAIQDRMGNPKTGRAGHYPSMVVHVVAGGLSFAILPMIAASGSLSNLGSNMSEPAFGRLVMAGIFNEIVSQYIYENVFDPLGENSGRYSY